MDNKKSKFSLSYIDLFGIQPRLYVNNKEKYRTSWGGILTFSLFVCMIIACWVYGKDMYFRESPTTTISEVPTSHPERFNITKETFNFSFGLQGNDRVNFIDETIYTLKLYQFQANKKIGEDGSEETEYIRKDLEPRRCTEDDFILDKNYFLSDKANLNMYCINYDIEDVYIEGVWGADRFASIVGKVYPCKNSTESDIICKSEQEIKDALTDNQYILNYSDQVVDPKNYTEPFAYVGKNSFGLASWDTYRQNNFYFSNVFIEDNVGIIFDSIEQNRGLQYAMDKELTKLGQHKDQLMVEFILRFQSSKEKKIYRTYLNLAEVMANVGGILKVLMIGGAFVSWIVSKQLFNLQLANQIFDFNTGESDDDNNKKKPQQKNRQIQFKSYLGLLFPFCASKKTKQNKEYLNFAVQKITQRLNMSYLLEKFVEIEKIKLLLLDHDQYKLFDYMATPTIDQALILHHEEQKKEKLLNKNKELDKEQSQENVPQVIKNFMLQENLSQEQKKENCINAYKQICLKKHKNDFDYKILNFVDDNIIKEIKFNTGEMDESIYQQKNPVNVSFIGNQNITLQQKENQQLNIQLESKQLFNKNMKTNSLIQTSVNTNNTTKIHQQKQAQALANQIMRTTQNNLQNQNDSQLQYLEQSQSQSNCQLNNNHQEIDNIDDTRNVKGNQQIQNQEDQTKQIEAFDGIQQQVEQQLSDEFIQTPGIQNLPNQNNSQLNSLRKLLKENKNQSNEKNVQKPNKQ